MKRNCVDIAIKTVMNMNNEPERIRFYRITLPGSVFDLGVCVAPTKWYTIE